MTLGLDLSTKSTGWCLFDWGVVECGCFSPEGEDWLERCFVVAENVEEELRNEEITQVIVEDTYFGRNVDTLKKLTTLRGMIVYIAHSKGVEVILKTPAQWRKEVGLKSQKRARANWKRAAVDFVKERYSLDVNDDVAEAVLIASSGGGQR